MDAATPTSDARETQPGSDQASEQRSAQGVVHVHYWASAKAAAGVAGDDLAVDGPVTLAEVVRRAAALHPGTKLPDVLQTCSALIGDRPVGGSDPDEVTVRPGETVEFLPPFAGG